MKPEILWLFGDNFVAPNYNPTNDFLVYHKRLEQDFIVKNFAFEGTGPEWSLQEFIHQDKKTDNDLKQKIGIVFCASHWNRFNFRFFKQPSDQYYCAESFNSPLWTKYSRYKIFVNHFFKQYVFNNLIYDNFILHNMLLVKHFAMNYNRCIYWPIFNDLGPGVRETYNNENFYIPDECMEKFVDRGPKCYELPNHMDEAKHNHVYEILKLAIF